MRFSPRRLPPPAKRLPVVSERPPIRARARAGAAEPGRVYALVGPRGVGVTTLAIAFAEESEGQVVRVEGSTWEQVETEVEAARSTGAEVVLLDGFPRDARDVQWLYDRRYVTPIDGGIVRIERAAQMVDPVYQALLAEIERASAALGMRPTVVHADDIETAAKQLFDVFGR